MLGVVSSIVRSPYYPNYFSVGSTTGRCSPKAISIVILVANRVMGLSLSVLGQ